MSTRSIIARKTLSGGWSGVYHHWDGYPSGLGATLYSLYNGHFNKDMQSMMHVLIDEHRGGWSTINDADWSQSPGFIERDFTLPADTKRRPQCYCHGDRHEGPYDLLTERDMDTWCEWAYVLDPQTTTITIYDLVNREWHYVATVDLNGPEPNWEALN